MIIDLGSIGYEEVLEIQASFVSKRVSGTVEDTYLIAEHPHVFTVGRSAVVDNLLVGKEYLKQRGIRVLEVDRGGDITYHGPGQIVIYPILDLRPDRQDLHKHLRYLESIAIDLVGSYGLEAFRLAGNTGVWVGAAKIASVGTGCRNWITFHGVSINVNTDLSYFSMINPCGLKDVRMTSLQRLLGRTLDIKEVKNRVKGIIYAASREFSSVA